MRAGKFYETVLALLGEEEYSCEDFTHLKFRIINQALAMCLSAHNTILKSRNEKTLSSFAPVVKDSDEIPLQDNMALEVAANYAAALLCSDRDRDKANVLSGMADEARRKYSMANFININNSY